MSTSATQPQYSTMYNLVRDRYIFTRNKVHFILSVLEHIINLPLPLPCLVVKTAGIVGRNALATPLLRRLRLSTWQIHLNFSPTYYSHPHPPLELAIAVSLLTSPEFHVTFNSTNYQLISPCINPSPHLRLHNTSLSSHVLGSTKRHQRHLYTPAQRQQSQCCEERSQDSHAPWYIHPYSVYVLTPIRLTCLRRLHTIRPALPCQNSRSREASHKGPSANLHCSRTHLPNRAQPSSSRRHPRLQPGLCQGR